MKRILFSLFFIFIISRYVIFESHSSTSCQSTIVGGSFFQHNKCYDITSKTKYTNHNNGTYQVHSGCNHACEECSNSRFENYGCVTFPETTTKRFGLIRGLRSKGFISQQFLETSTTCDESKEIASIFSINEHCQIISTKDEQNPHSGKLEWNEQRKEMEHIHYNEPNCRGSILKREFFPLNKCIKIESRNFMSYIFKRNL